MLIHFLSILLTLMIAGNIAIAGEVAMKELREAVAEESLTVATEEVLAEEYPAWKPPTDEPMWVEVTPAKKFTTANKHTKVGDVVEFKATMRNPRYGVEAGDSIYGTIVDYEPNAFDWHARVIFDDFKTADNKPLKGDLFLGKRQSKRPCGPMEGPEILLLPLHIASFEFQKIIRGSEVTIRPDKDVFYIDPWNQRWKK